MGILDNLEKKPKSMSGFFSNSRLVRWLADVSTTTEPVRGSESGHQPATFLDYNPRENRVIRRLPDMLDNNAELRRRHARLKTFIEGTMRDTVPPFPPAQSSAIKAGNLGRRRVNPTIVGLIDPRISKE